MKINSKSKKLGIEVNRGFMEDESENWKKSSDWKENGLEVELVKLCPTVLVKFWNIKLKVGFENSMERSGKRLLDLENMVK